MKFKTAWHFYGNLTGSTPVMFASRTIKHSPLYGWHFNIRLVMVTGLLSSLILWKLYQVAIFTDNMNGFWYSALNVIAVACATIYTLKK